MRNDKVRYWLRIQVPILIIAAAMSQVGAYLWFAFQKEPMFNSRDLFLPSCLTWMLLAPFIAGGTWRRSTAIGLLSPMVGSFFVVLLRIGPIAQYHAEGIAGFLALFMYGLVYIGNTVWITLPAGALAGNLIGAVFTRWPPPTDAVLFKEFPWPKTERGRLIITLLPLVPLLAMGLKIKPDQTAAVVAAPTWIHLNIVVPTRMLADIYFSPMSLLAFKLHLIHYLGALRIIYAACVSLAVFKASKRQPSNHLIDRPAAR